MHCQLPIITLLLCYFMDYSEEKITANIVQLRKLKQLSQSAVANILQVDVATISRIERGKIALTYHALADIANMFGMSVIDLITYPGVYSRVNQPWVKVRVELELTTEEWEKFGMKDKVKNLLEQ
jgi:transcriptional regulator with XRE-family HTH domain